LHTGEVALKWIDDHRSELTNLSDKVWSYAELHLREFNSADAQIACIKKQGFDVKVEIAGMPTAFIATWGSGRPIIGFLGEFDALPGCSNEAAPVRKEVAPGGSGHACGHNLLGVAALAAAVAMKEELARSGASGTVRYYGCPAEEYYGGKAFMAREGGLLDDLDACLTWHPGSMNMVRGGSSLAVIGVKFHFHGRTAHAAGSPHHGRSALDAVEIMNVGVNYLREHIIEKARIHYVITNGGMAPNVVPAEATVWYFIRAPQNDQLEELFARVKKCAEGAAHMTETTHEVELGNALANVLSNKTLEKVLEIAMKQAGPPKWTEEDHAFAREIAKTFAPGQLDTAVREEGLPAELQTQVLNTTIVPKPTIPPSGRGSTDVGDASWVAPTAQFSMACQALGTPGHSWQVTAQSGMGIGHAGMIAAARTLVLAGLYLADHPDVVKAAREEFEQTTVGRKYKCMMPPELKPPLFSRK